MSVINKVLLDLDKRQEPGIGNQPPPANIKPTPAPSKGHEWFWRTVALLVLVALGWVGWVVYQIQPRPIATELAEEAAERAAKRPAPKPVAQAPIVVPQVVPPATPATPPVAPQAAAPAQAPAAAKPAPQPEPMRFAYSIETPIQAPAPKPKVEAIPPKVEAAKKPAAEKARFERRDLALSPADKAESEFRRGVDLLKRGRTSEAEAAFRSALAADSKHRGARQAQVALRLERGDLEEASRLLNETLAADPRQADFAVAMARIHVERADLPAALAVLDGAAAEEQGDVHLMRGTVLQRMGRHAQAADAYRAALRTNAPAPHAWLGLGISLEAQQKRAEAAQAFRNALAAGGVNAEVRTFAEQRIQALR